MTIHSWKYRGTLKHAYWDDERKKLVPTTITVAKDPVDAVAVGRITVPAQTIKESVKDVVVSVE